MKGAEVEQIRVAGNDVVGGALDRRLQNPVVVVVVNDGKHAVGYDHDATGRNEVRELRAPWITLASFGYSSTRRSSASTARWSRA